MGRNSWALVAVRIVAVLVTRSSGHGGGDGGGGGRCGGRGGRCGDHGWFLPLELAAKRAHPVSQPLRRREARTRFFFFFFSFFTLLPRI